jgi:hypothetical protein
MLHRNAGPEALGLLRWVVFGLWFVTILIGPPLSRLAALPPELFSPPGVLALLPDGIWSILLTVEGLTVLSMGTLALTLAAAVGARPFWLVGPLAFAGVLMVDGIQKGHAGFINHGQMGILYGALLVAISPAAHALTPFRRNPSVQGSGEGAYRFPLVGLALLLAITYSLIGIHRLAVGGWAVFTGDALPTYLALRTFEYMGFGFEGSVLLLQYPGAVAFLNAGFLVVTLFEILSPLALVWRRFRWVWLAVIAPFHLATLFTMNIFFWENLILLAVVFTDLPTWVQERRRTGFSTPGPLAQAGGRPQAT